MENEEVSAIGRYQRAAMRSRVRQVVAIGFSTHANVRASDRINLPREELRNDRLCAYIVVEIEAQRHRR